MKKNSDSGFNSEIRDLGAFPPPIKNMYFVQTAETSDVFPQSSVCLTDTFFGTGAHRALFTRFNKLGAIVFDPGVAAWLRSPH